MQNFDYFSGVPDRPYNSPYETREIDLLVKNNSANFIHNGEKQKGKAGFMAFLICTLVIVSFTGGLVVGLKYGDKDKPIIDENTQRRISNLKPKISSNRGSSTLDSNKEPANSAQKSFPARDYPFAIRIAGEFDKKTTLNIAETLSEKGYTVILSQVDSSNKYRLFVGPYKTQTEAFKILKMLDANEDTKHLATMDVIRRS